MLSPHVEPVCGTVGDALQLPVDNTRVRNPKNYSLAVWLRGFGFSWGWVKSCAGVRRVVHGGYSL